MQDDVFYTAWAIEVTRLVNRELEFLSLESDGIMARDGITSLGPAELMSSSLLRVAIQTHGMFNVRQAIVRDLKQYWLGMDPRDPQIVANVAVSEISNFRALPLKRQSDGQWTWG